MKNLENYGVLELNAKEIRETDGGSLLLGYLAAAAAAAYLLHEAYTLGYYVGEQLADAVNEYEENQYTPIN